MFRFINLWTGRRWWYEVELEYRDKSGQQLAFMRTQIGLATRSDILDARGMKKEFAPKFMRGVFKHRLCNGSVNFRVVAYLGWLKFRASRKGWALATEDLFTAWLGMLLESRKAR